MLTSAYLTLLSQPAKDRLIYRFLCRTPVRSILEMGLGTGVRSRRMVQLAARHCPPQDLRYVGVDRFESRTPAVPGWTLKQAYRALSAAGVRPRLVPGDPYSALCGTANDLGLVDLVVVSGDEDADAMSRAWAYLPRILRPDSAVFLEEAASREPCAQGWRFRRVPWDEIQARAREGVRRVRRAA